MTLVTKGDTYRETNIEKFKKKILFVSTSIIISLLKHFLESSIYRSQLSQDPGPPTLPRASLRPSELHPSHPPASPSTVLSPGRAVSVHPPLLPNNLRFSITRENICYERFRSSSNTADDQIVRIRQDILTFSILLWRDGKGPETLRNMLRSATCMPGQIRLPAPKPTVSLLLGSGWAAISAIETSSLFSLKRSGLKRRGSG